MNESAQMTSSRNAMGTPSDGWRISIKGSVARGTELENITAAGPRSGEKLSWRN
jgi:hypothetical protein